MVVRYFMLNPKIWAIMFKQRFACVHLQHTLKDIGGGKFNYLIANRGVFFLMMSEDISIIVSDLRVPQFVGANTVNYIYYAREGKVF